MIRDAFLSSRLDRQGEVSKPSPQSLQDPGTCIHRVRYRGAKHWIDFQLRQCFTLALLQVSTLEQLGVFLSSCLLKRLYTFVSRNVLDSQSTKRQVSTARIKFQNPSHAREEKVELLPSGSCTKDSVIRR